MDEINPFAAPATIPVDFVAPDAASRWRPRWRWLRFIPLGYFGVFAAMLLPGAVFLLGFQIYLLARVGRLDRIPSLMLAKWFVNDVTYASLGIFAFYTSRAWWNCRWRQAWVMSVLFFGLIGVGAVCC